MEFLGEIISEPDPPGISNDRWVELIPGHPNLEAGAPLVKEGTNPFTRKPMIYRAPCDFAWVNVAGKRVGRTDYGQDQFEPHQRLRRPADRGSGGSIHRGCVRWSVQRTSCGWTFAGM